MNKRNVCLFFTVLSIVACGGTKMMPPAPRPTGDFSWFRTGVDYSVHAGELLDAGYYDRVDPWVVVLTPRDTVNTPGGWIDDEEMALIHFVPHYSVSTEYVLDQLERLGLRPATSLELFHFGAEQPHYQRLFPIAALGSLWSGARSEDQVAVLGGDSRERFVSLRSTKAPWSTTYRFLAFRMADQP